MSDARKTARLRFAAALALYFLWVAALAALAVLSSSRPAANKRSDQGVAALRLGPAQANTSSDAPLGKSKHTTTAEPSRCTVLDLS